MLQWDYDKNEIDPTMVTAGSHKKVWWKCPVAPDHSWEASIQNRAKSKGTTCPCCCNRRCVPSNCLHTTHPKLVKEWDYSKNIIEPTDITQGYNKKAWWKCSKCNQSWTACVNARTGRGDGCPYCYNRASPSNNLAVNFPNAIKEWDYEKNDIRPTELLPNSMKKVWWKCVVSKEHRWKASPNNRVGKKHKCPYCSGKKPDSTTSLLAKQPDICLEWDYDNNVIRPEELMPQSHKKVWWVCSEEKTHRWKASPLNRVGSQSRCPYCNHSSKGENLIDCYLTEMGETFSREYKIPECKDKRSLPFDFAIHSSKLGLIEFQGQQHYKSVKLYGGEKTFQKQKIRDKIKKDYCKDNDIPFLEIRYDQTGEIPRMIDSFIRKLSI